MTTYFAVVDPEGPHVKKNIDTGQLEIYEEREDAVRALRTGTEVMVVKIQRASTKPSKPRKMAVGSRSPGNSPSHS